MRMTRAHDIRCHRMRTQAINSDAVFVNGSVERDSRDAHLLRGLLDIVAIAFEGRSDQGRFNVGTRAGEVLRNGRGILLR